MPFVFSALKFLRSSPASRNVMARKVTTGTSLKEPKPINSFGRTKKLKLASDLVGAAVWWGVLWYLWDKYDTLTSDYYPDPRAWMRYKQQQIIQDE